jgi:response regulator RpfG family c-di-GMP phosphodiesterase
MIKILLVTSEREPFAEFAEVLNKKDFIEIVWAESGQSALNILGNNPSDLVVVNENLDDMTGIEFLKKLLPINPMINTAAVSPLSPEEFHEASEGLGVLMQLPVSPSKLDAENLLQSLNALKNLLKPKF